MILRTGLPSISMGQRSNVGRGGASIDHQGIELPFCRRCMVSNSRLPEIVVDAACDQAGEGGIIINSCELIPDTCGIRPLTFDHAYPVVIVEGFIQDAGLATGDG